MRILAFLMVFLSQAAFSSQCEKWQYANLSILIVKVFSEKSQSSLEKLKFYTTWNEPGSSGFWIDDQIMTGAIKKNLLEYFSVTNIGYPEILNSIGSRGWEAYSSDRTVVSKNEDKYDWSFKRCVGGSQK